jgi:DNA-binding NarL/FixJ family response regulator
VRDGITAMLAEQPDFPVVASVDRARTGLERVRATKPVVVLVDAALGDHDSHRLVAEIKQATPEVRVIVMDLLPEPQDVYDFVTAGASGFLAKDATLDEFVTTVRRVASGVLWATMPRGQLAVGVVNGIPYAVGGQSSSVAYSSTDEAYHP